MSDSNNSGKKIEEIATARLCHIAKCDDFEGYGFNLHSEKGKHGQYIGKVDDNSPALFSGIKEGDRIIEVNGTNIGTETHKQVVQRIKSLPNEVRLLVVDSKIDVTKDNQILTEFVIKELTSIQSSNNNDQTANNTSAEEYQKTIEVLNEKLSIDNTDSEIICNDNNLRLSTPPSPTTSTDFEGNTHLQISKSTPIQSSSSSTFSASVEEIKKNETSNGSVSHSSGNASLTTNPQLLNDPLLTNDEVNLQHGDVKNKNNHTDAAGLDLKMTAAEMRAKHFSRKKFDPKKESVDLKRKYEIIQKL